LSAFPSKKASDDDIKKGTNVGKKEGRNDKTVGKNENQIDPKPKGKSNTAISSLYVHNISSGDDERNYVFFGCKDGSINIFDASNMNNTNYDPVFIYAFDIHSLNASNILLPQVQSIAIYNNNSNNISNNNDNTMLVCIGTRSCDIIEAIVSVDVMSKSTKLYKSSAASAKHSHDLSCGIIMQSHFSDELWGITTHPLLPQYCSVGDDRTMRFYSIHQRSMIRCVNLGLIARTCCYNSDGRYVAVGFGGRLGKGE